MSLVGCKNALRLTCRFLRTEVVRVTTKASLRMLENEEDTTVQPLSRMPELTTFHVMMSWGKTSKLTAAILQCPTTIQKLIIEQDGCVGFPLYSVLSRLPKLTYLQFWSNLRKWPTAAALVHLQLQHLDLNDNMLSRDVEGMVKGIGALPQLECLKIGRNGLDASALTKVLRAMTQLSRMRDLDMCTEATYFDLDTIIEMDEDVREFSAALGAVSTLRRLNVSNFVLAPRLIWPACLEQLIMEGCFVLHFGALPITLVHLDIGRAAYITPDIMVEVAAALKPLTGLKHLNMCCLGVGAHDLTHVGLLLARALSLLTSLEHLDLHGCCLSEAAMQELAGSLAMLTHLRHLDLAYNDIGESGAAALRPALGCMKSLRELVMVDTGMEEVGACVQMAHALSMLPSLQRLDLTYIGSEGLRVLLPALGRLRMLMRLALSTVDIDDVLVGWGDLELLIPVLGSMPFLNDLKLNFYLTVEEREEAMSALREVLSNSANVLVN